MARFKQSINRGAALAAVVSLVLNPLLLHAAPEGGQVTAGSGSISQSAGNTDVLQQSQRLAVDWQSFNLDAGERVRFLQPGANALVLNRILDANPSTIRGLIEANGHVILANPRGIIFTESATLNVGSLVAAAAEVPLSSFFNGGSHLELAASADGVVINRGVIEAAMGVSLFGASVANEGGGFISGELVQLAAGERAVVTFDPAGMIGVEVSGDSLGSMLGAAVSNAGEIQAGAVLMEASVASGMFDAAVNNSGVVKAAGIDTRGGKIRLRGRGGDVVNDGQLLATGTRGGEILINSDKAVSLGATSVADASGANAGGQIAIGGRTVGDAKFVSVAEGALLAADATDAGQGGSVDVLAVNEAVFAGHISARGAGENGDGGTVEVSAAAVAVTGTVDTRAQEGRTGSFVIDPVDITIGNDPAANTISFSDLEANLNTTTVEIVTTDPAPGTTDPGEAGNITITEGGFLNLNNNSQLTLSAHNDVIFNEGLSVGGAALDLIIEANKDGVGAGAVFINPNAEIRTNGGNFQAGGASIQLDGMIETFGPTGVAGFVNLVAMAAMNGDIFSTDLSPMASRINAEILALDADGDIALRTNVGAVTADAGGAITLYNNRSLSIGNMPAPGVPALGGLVAANGDIRVGSSGQLQVLQAVSQTGTGDIVLSAMGSSNIDTLNINAPVTTAGGNIRLDAGGSLFINALVDASGEASINAGSNNDLFFAQVSQGAGDSGVTGSLMGTDVRATVLFLTSGSQGALLGTDISALSFDSFGSVSINNIGDLGIVEVKAQGGNATLTAGGQIFDANPTMGSVDIIANEISLTATGVGTGMNPLQVDAFNGVNVDTALADGDQWLSSNSGLSIGQIQAGTGTVHLQSAFDIFGFDLNGFSVVDAAALEAVAGNSLRLRTRVSALAASTQTGSLEIANEGDVSVTTVGSTSGVQILDATFGPAPLNLEISGSLSAVSPIANASDGEILLRAREGGMTADIMLAAAVSGSGNIFLEALEDISLTGMASVLSSGGDLTIGGLPDNLPPLFGGMGGSPGAGTPPGGFGPGGPQALSLMMAAGSSLSAPGRMFLSADTVSLQQVTAGQEIRVNAIDVDFNAMAQLTGMSMFEISVNANTVDMAAGSALQAGDGMITIGGNDPFAFFPLADRFTMQAGSALTTTGGVIGIAAIDQQLADLSSGGGIGLFSDDLTGQISQLAGSIFSATDLLILDATSVDLQTAVQRLAAKLSGTLTLNNSGGLQVSSVELDPTLNQLSGSGIDAGGNVNLEATATIEVLSDIEADGEVNLVVLDSVDMDGSGTPLELDNIVIKALIETQGGVALLAGDGVLIEGEQLIAGLGSGMPISVTQGGRVLGIDSASDVLVFAGFDDIDGLLSDVLINNGARIIAGNELIIDAPGFVGNNTPFQQVIEGLEFNNPAANFGQKVQALLLNEDIVQSNAQGDILQLDNAGGPSTIIKTVDIEAERADIIAGGTILLDTRVGQLLAENTQGDVLVFNLNPQRQLRIGERSGSLPAKGINIGNGNVFIGSASSMVVQGNIVLDNPGNIELTVADQFDFFDQEKLIIDAAIRTSDGDIRLVAGDSILVNFDVISAAGDLELMAGYLDVDGLASPILMSTTFTNVLTATGRVNLFAKGDINVSHVRAGGAVTLFTDSAVLDTTPFNDTQDVFPTLIDQDDPSSTIFVTADNIVADSVSIFADSIGLAAGTPDLDIAVTSGLFTQTYAGSQFIGSEQALPVGDLSTLGGFIDEAAINAFAVGAFRLSDFGLSDLHLLDVPTLLDFTNRQVVGDISLSAPVLLDADPMATIAAHNLRLEALSIGAPGDGAIDLALSGALFSDTANAGGDQFFSSAGDLTLAAVLALINNSGGAEGNVVISSGGVISGFADPDNNTDVIAADLALLAANGVDNLRTRVRSLGVSASTGNIEVSNKSLPFGFGFLDISAGLSTGTGGSGMGNIVIANDTDIVLRGAVANLDGGDLSIATPALLLLDGNADLSTDGGDMLFSGVDGTDLAAFVMAPGSSLAAQGDIAVLAEDAVLESVTASGASNVSGGLLDISQSIQRSGTSNLRLFADSIIQRDGTILQTDEGDIDIRGNGTALFNLDGSVMSVSENSALSFVMEAGADVDSISGDVDIAAAGMVLADISTGGSIELDGTSGFAAIEQQAGTRLKAVGTLFTPALTIDNSGAVDLITEVNSLTATVSGVIGVAGQDRADLSVANTGALELGRVSAEHGEVNISTGSPLLVANIVSALLDIFLSAGESAATDDHLTLESNVNSSAGGVSLSAGDQIRQMAGTVTAASDLAYQAGVNDMDGVSGVVMTETSSGVAANAISVSSGGASTLGSLSAGTMVAVNVSGSLSDDGSASTVVDAPMVSLQAASGIGSGAALGVNTQQLMAMTTNGDLQLQNMASGAVQLNGLTTGGNGSISYRQDEGSSRLEAAAGVGGAISSNGGSVVLALSDFVNVGSIDSGNGILTVNLSGAAANNLDLGSVVANGGVNVNGGNGADVIVFSNSVSGQINVATGAGADRLQMNSGASVNGIANLGDGEDVFVGNAAGQQFDFAGVNTVTVDSVLALSNVDNLLAGAGNDQLNFAGGARFDGLINSGDGDDGFRLLGTASLLNPLVGGKGIDRFTAAPVTTEFLLLDAQTVSANGLQATQFEQFVAGSATDVLRTSDAGATVSILAQANTARLGGVDFIGIGRLQGGSGVDVINIADGANFGGAIDTGGGNDRVVFDAGSATLGASITGGLGDDVFEIGGNLGSTSLQGGLGNDSFVLNDNARGVIAGGVGGQDQLRLEGNQSNSFDIAAGSTSILDALGGVRLALQSVESLTDNSSQAPSIRSGSSSVTATAGNRLEFSGTDSQTLTFNQNAGGTLGIASTSIALDQLVFSGGNVLLDGIASGNVSGTGSGVQVRTGQLRMVNINNAQLRSDVSRIDASGAGNLALTNSGTLSVDRLNFGGNIIVISLAGDLLNAGAALDTNVVGGSVNLQALGDIGTQANPFNLSAADVSLTATNGAIITPVIKGGGRVTLFGIVRLSLTQLLAVSGINAAVQTVLKQLGSLDAAVFTALLPFTADEESVRFALRELQRQRLLAEGDVEPLVGPLLQALKDGGLQLATLASPDVAGL